MSDDVRTLRGRKAHHVKSKHPKRKKHLSALVASSPEDFKINHVSRWQILPDEGKFYAKRSDVLIIWELDTLLRNVEIQNIRAISLYVFLEKPNRILESLGTRGELKTATYGTDRRRRRPRRQKSRWRENLKPWKVKLDRILDALLLSYDDGLISYEELLLIKLGIQG